MAVDIGTIIKFNPPGENKLPKMAINGILNVPICVKRWRVDRSRFTDGNPDGLFVELEFAVVSDGREYRTNTGSGVIISQLEEIEKAYPGGTEFTCIIRRSGKCYKMFPAQDGPAK